MQLNFRRPTAKKEDASPTKNQKAQSKTAKAFEFVKSIAKCRVKTAQPKAHLIQSALYTGKAEEERRETIKELELFQTRLKCVRLISISE